MKSTIGIEKYLHDLNGDFPKSAFSYMRIQEHADSFKNFDDREFKIFTNVSKLEFRHLYLNVIVFLFNHKVLNFGNDVDTIQRIQEVEQLLNNENKSDFEEYLKQGKFIRKSYLHIFEKYPKEISKMHHFIHLMFNDLRDDNPNIIEIDTDMIFYEDEIDIQFDWKYSISKLIYFLPIKIKKSLSINSKFEIESRGMYNGVSSSQKEKENTFLNNLLISRIREDKIDLIL